MMQAQCPASAPFFGFMGITAALVRKSTHTIYYTLSYTHGRGPSPHSHVHTYMQFHMRTTKSHTRPDTHILLHFVGLRQPRRRLRHCQERCRHLVHGDQHEHTHIHTHTHTHTHTRRCAHTHSLHRHMHTGTQHFDSHTLAHEKFLHNEYKREIAYMNYLLLMLTSLYRV
jgi:hypothetical protein